MIFSALPSALLLVVSGYLHSAAALPADSRQYRELIPRGQSLNILRRQESTSTSTPTPSPTPAPAFSTPLSGDINQLDEISWDNQTQAACTRALSSLNGMPPNPAGMAVCYNMPYLNISSGTFQASLLLYRISPATGDWANVTTKDLNLDLTYSSASVSPANSTNSTNSTSTSTRRGLIARQSFQLERLESFLFTGQLNQSLLTPNMSTTSLQFLLTPTVTLVAPSPSGGNLSVSLSARDAFFIYGALATPADPTPTEFVLPGTRVAIFPVGAVITGIWATLGIGAVGWGTWQRYRFREQYRRRMKRAEGTVKSGKGRVPY
ncbi:MAG: hypothetical protein M1829_000796 [Trizodia sp. TS-e1964]|nr:MAG: hypothetical protein M1829_000796 [Trizodia sp. TS-e1964]